MSPQQQTRLIIGCGYLGRRVAQRWVDAGDDVVALTRSARHADKFRENGIRPAVGDVLRPETLYHLPPAETVLYAVGYDPSGAASKRAVYIDGLRNVLAALPASVGQFLYVSSTSVYGQSNGERVDETSPCVPRTDGGRICLDAEQLVRSTLKDRTPMQILRLSGIYGPGRLIARIDGLRERRPLPRNPNGWLNLIHVADAAAAVIAIADQNAPASDVLLVSDDRPCTRRDYYEMLAQLVGTAAPIFESDNITAAEVSTPDLGKWCDNRRLRRERGIALAFPTIDEGLPDAVRDAV